MCGIAGFSGNFSQQVLIDMTQTINHRGPDDFGTFFDDNKQVGLGHKRLSILDLTSAGHQPMECPSKRYIICYNGEVYNFRELRTELIAKGCTFNSESDTEVLLHLYIIFGKEMLSKLNGIFAFAIYDKQTEELFIARDHFGTKPFYYVTSDEGFAFSSELKSLLKIPNLDKTIDLETISYHLRFLWSPSPNTMFKSVKKLKPAHYMIVKSGQITETKRFYIPPYLDKPPIISEKEAITEVDRLLEQAVKRQLVSDVQVGAFLSGGLDSTSLAYYAQKHSSQKLECFTIKIDDEQSANEGFAEDLPYAKKAAEFLGTKLNVVTVGPEMVRELDKMIYHLDEPQADFAALNTMFICGLARQNDIKVLLSGAGGDDLFSGYRRHQALEFEKYWSWAPKSARSLLKSSASMLPASSATSRRLKKAFQYANLDNQERLLSYFYWLSPEESFSLFKTEYRSELMAKQLNNPVMAELKNVSHLNPLEQMLHLERQFFLCDHNLNYTDKMSMAHGVEVRVPFLDIDLVNMAVNLPPSLKQNGKIGKSILKKTMEKHLPHDIIYRPKTGFGVPLRYWLKNQLADVVHDTLSEQTIIKRGIFDYNAIQKLINLDSSGTIDASYTIFSLVCMELWLQKFAD